MTRSGFIPGNGCECGEKETAKTGPHRRHSAAPPDGGLGYGRKLRVLGINVRTFDSPTQRVAFSDFRSAPQPYAPQARASRACAKQSPRAAFAANTVPVPETPAPEYPLPNRLRETLVTERPQERLQRLGAAALSDTELLAMLLRSGTRGHDVLTLATRLITEAGSLGALIGWREEDFRRLKGIGRVKALQLLTVMEIARRVLGQQAGEEPLLNTADLISAYLQPIVAGLSVEKFYVLCLNRRNRLQKRVELTSGTATSTLAHPREVYRVAVRESAAAIVCAHNHPSGDPAPSAPDLQVTRMLREAARTVDIPLLDHVIIGRAAADPAGRGYFSFREAGLL